MAARPIPEGMTIFCLPVFISVVVLRFRRSHCVNQPWTAWKPHVLSNHRRQHDLHINTQRSAGRRWNL